MSMATDENDLVREQGMRRVLMGGNWKECTIFNMPRIDFDAKAYCELID